VDRVLEPERQAEVAAYLGDHPDVAKRVASFTDQRNLLRAALARSRGAVAGGAQSVANHRNRARRPSLAGGDAAMLFLSIGGLGGWAVRGALQASPADWLRSLRRRLSRIASTHRTAFDRRGSRVRLCPTRAVGLRPAASAVKVPDLTTSGYRLMEAACRHLARPAAMFMYDDDRCSRIVVLIDR